MIVQLMNESAGFAYRRVAALRPYLLCSGKISLLDSNKPHDLWIVVNGQVVAELREKGLKNSTKPNPELFEISNDTT